MMGFDRAFVLAGLVIAALVALTVAGCSSNLEGTLAPTDDGVVLANDAALADDAPLADDAVFVPGSVEVVFENYSLTAAVSAEFHATNIPLANPSVDLFIQEYVVNSGIGLAGTGIIEPAHQDSITFPCTASLTLGTTGCRFLDRDTGELLGTGEARWVADAQLGLCGRVVTFEFTDIDGIFATNVRLD